MDVVVVGGHGKVARRLLALLSQGGHRARGVIRNPDRAADVEAIGAEPVLCDIEREELDDAVKGADAVVFAAGAGPGSGPERKRTVDLGGALKLIDAARSQGISRYLMISSMGADAPEAGPERMRPYLRAKAEADGALQASGLNYTITRPGMLTDDPGVGRIDAALKLGRRGSITREDVAATLLAELDAPNTIGKTFEELEGDTPIEEAVRAL